MDNKCIESGHFKCFRQLLSDFPLGEVFHEDDPDFLIHSDGRILGIEHRQLFKLHQEGQIPAQATESLLEEIVHQAQEHAELQGMPPVDVGFFFERNISISKTGILPIARDVARFIQANMPDLNGYVDLEFDPFLRRIQLDFILVHRSHHLSRHNWHVSEAGEVQENIQAELQNAIDDKATKIARYLEKCDECWLLIVSDGVKPSSFLRPDASSRGHTYSSPFSRTFFLDCMRGKLIKLLTT